MVTRQREGTRVRYALAGDDVLALWLALRDASAARLAEVERAARDYLGEEVEAIGREELIERLGRGDVVLVDVRPAEEFAAGHIEGARSIPLERARAAPRRAAGRPRSRRVLPRPLLRLRTRGGPAPAGRGPPRPATRGRLARMAAGRREIHRIVNYGGGSSMSTTTKQLDTGELEERVKRMYEEVALEPEREFHFETGRPLAERLGYPAADLDRIPAGAIESFAGVGYFLDLAAIEPGDTVLDLGSGSGMDSFLAALAAGPSGRVIGVDMTDEQLAKAERLAARGRLRERRVPPGLHRAPTRRGRDGSTA